MRALLLSSLLMTGQVFAYTFGLTTNDSKIRWNRSDKKIGIKINYNRFGNSTANLSDSEIKSVVEESIVQFDALNDYEIFLTTKTSEAVAEIIFSNKSQYFGASALAITSLQYSDDTGDISEGKIIINDSSFAPFDLVAYKNVSDSDETYLGNIISHELGHLLGLDHSEVIGSAMFYSVFKGQNIISDDDKNGFKDLYNTLKDKKISGIVVAQNFVPAFGVHIRLYDKETNKVLQGQITNSEGQFEFKNVPSGKYFITVDRLYNPDAISITEDATNYQICNKSDIVLAPFGTCGNLDRGYPQVIEVTDSNIDLGFLAINCEPKLNSGFLISKLEDDYYELDLNQGSVFWGYVDPDQISISDDKLKLDLREFEITPSNQVVNLKFDVSSLYNKFEADILIKREDQLNFTSYPSGFDSIYDKKRSDLDISFVLSTVEENNILYIKIVPKLIDFTDQKDLVGTPSIFTPVLYHYLLSYDFESESVFTSYEDNSSCLEGNIFVRTGVDNLSEDEEQNSTNSAPTCGTIDDRGGPQGPLSFLLGLSFLLILIASKKTKSLSKYLFFSRIS